MNCKHYGDKAGDMVKQCCGGQETRAPIYHCHSPDKPEEYCIPVGGQASMVTIEVDGERSMRRVAKCDNCQFRDEPDPRPIKKYREPEPTPESTLSVEQSFTKEVIPDVKPAVTAMDLWLEIRRKRRFEQHEPAQPVWRSTVKSPRAKGENARHLLYHLGPMWHTDAWKRGVQELLKRLNVFNGRRIIAIVTGDKFEDPELVRQEFNGHEVEFCEVPNKSNLREVRTFKPMFEQLVNDPGITFYAHSKGVTRPFDDTTTVHRWTDILRETLLDYMPLIEEQLKTHPVTGSFKKVGYGFEGSQSTWHYSGSFWWFRNKDLFAKDWERIDYRWWGIESYLGLHFKPEEAGCVFHSGACPTLDCYSMSYMKDVVEPEYKAWKEQHESVHA